MLAWPPPYTVKHHPLARRVKLKISPTHGLQLVVPMKFNVKHVPKILLQHREWIEKHFEIITHSTPAVIDEAPLPDTIHLQAINQIWQVRYMAANTRLSLILGPHNQVIVVGKIDQKAHCKKLLVNWLKDLAKFHLAENLAVVSKKIGLPYQKITIRDQKTRWGSCTLRGAISLNYKILFLPAPLAEHVLIHELCHTVQHNHSEKFWNLVAAFDSNWRVHRRQLKKNDHVPGWVV